MKRGKEEKTAPLDATASDPAFAQSGDAIPPFFVEISDFSEDCLDLQTARLGRWTSRAASEDVRCILFYVYIIQ